MVATHADVAQLVEHHLAKVRVAGSNPVVRSERNPLSGGGFVVFGPAQAHLRSYRSCFPVPRLDNGCRSVLPTIVPRIVPRIVPTYVGPITARRSRGRAKVVVSRR